MDESGTATTLGARLKSLRGNQRVGAFLRGAGVDVDQSTYLRWENDVTKNPGVTDLAKIALRYGTTLEWLLTGRDGDGPTPPPADLLSTLERRLDVIDRELRSLKRTVSRLEQRAEQ